MMAGMVGIASLALMLGGKLDWLTGIIILVSVALAAMYAIMGDVSAAARGLAAAGIMLGLSLVMDKEFAQLDKGIGDIKDMETELNDSLSLNTEATEGLAEKVDKVNAKDMTVSIPIVINFGTEIAGMTREQFEDYATTIINNALVDGLRKAGLYEVRA